MQEISWSQNQNKGVSTGLSPSVMTVERYPGRNRRKSPENEVAWVPLPGHKRSAPDNDIYFDKELGPGPAKQFAVDESYADVVLAPGPPSTAGWLQQRSAEESRWNGEWKPLESTSTGGLQLSSENTPPVPMDDEQMQEEEDLVPGANNNECSENFGGGGGNNAALHEGRVHENNRRSVRKDSYGDVESCEDDDDDEDGDNEYPKLIVFEGLRDVLSKKPSGDFALPRTLVNQMKKESSMAMVVWKPLLGSSTSDGNSCARTTAANRVVRGTSQPKQSQAINNEEEDDKEDVMDLSV